MWIFSRQLTESSIAKTLFWIAVANTVLSLPNIALIYGVHQWTEAVFGFGARSIAIVDAAASTPFAQLSMVPLLTLAAYYAPPGHRATWFALMASLMNIAVVALIGRAGNSSQVALGRPAKERTRKNPSTPCRCWGLGPPTDRQRR
jgi:hypothetical protein